MEKIIHYLKKPLGAFSKLPLGREHLLENFDHKNERHLYLAVLFSLFCVTAVSSIVVFMFKYEPSNAQKAQPQASVKPQTETEFLSNEILVKVKKTVKSKVKGGNSLNTGIASLNKINGEIKASKFEKVAKEGKNSKADADVFSWYKVTIEGNQEILSDKDTHPSILWLRDLQTGITSKNPKELKKQQLKGAMARLLTDPNVEAVEFNFVVHTDQVPTPTPAPTDVPVVDLKVDGSDGTITKTPPATYTLTWNATNGATTCVAGGTWGGDKSAPSGSWSFTGVGLLGLKTYTLTCSNAYGSGSDTVYVNIVSGTATPTPTPTPPPILDPGCTLSVNSVTAGGTVTVTSVSGLFGSIGMQGSYGTPVYSNLGNLIANGSTPIVVPLDAQGGLYTVRVGVYAVGCTPNLSVIATPTPTPTPPLTQLCPTSSPNIPNDPYSCTSGAWGQAFPDLWGMKKINAENAWKQSTGSAQIIVASVDTGVDRNHEDLAANMWVNSSETPDNGIDDDADGYVDDYYGWDFANGDNDPIDDQGHGTHTAGTIGAVGNNGLGVVGVNWNVKIMALKFLSKSGSGSSENGANAIIYAADHGARVINNSWGTSGASKIIHDAVEYAASKNVLVVSSAGNAGSNASGLSPASEPNSMAIAASDANDNIASFSNYGYKIDVAAPGVDILSTRSSQDQICASKVVGIGYCRLSGTSMAAPHVSGLAALIIAQAPAFTVSEVRQVIRASADDFGQVGFDPTFGSGRINAQRALTVSSVLNVAITSPLANATITGNSSITISGTASGVNFANYKLSWAKGTDLNSWNLIKDSNTAVNNGILGIWNTQTIETGFYLVKLEVKDSNNLIYTAFLQLSKEENVRSIVTAPSIQTGPVVWKDKIIWSDDRSGTRHIYLWDDTSKVEKKISSIENTYKFWPAIYENKVVWLDQQNGSGVWLYDLSTGITKILTNGDNNKSALAIWGDSIIYSAYNGSSRDIYLQDINTEVTKKLSSSLYYKDYTALSGSKVVWREDDGSVRFLNSYDLATGLEKRITDATLNIVDRSSIWGDKVVFSATKNGSQDIYLYDFSNNQLKQITNDLWNNSYPSIWENKVVWQDDSSGNSDIYMYDMATGKKSQITTNPANQSSPVIFGDRIVFVDWRNVNANDLYNLDIYMYDVPINPDLDNDGFLNTVEAYVGTDSNSACGLNAWPPDIDGDGQVSILDITRMAQAYGSKAGDAKYKVRYDMDADGAITILDLNIAAQYFTSKCTNPVKSK